VRSPSLEIIANGPIRPATAAWHDALAPLILRHPNGWSRVVLRLTCRSDAPRLHVSLDANPCTLTGEIKHDFAISDVKLSYFPGARLAQAWIACAWAGFLMHEALELVTIGDHATQVLPPHAEPYPANPFNRPLREVLPVELTPETLRAALAVVMGESAAAEMIAKEAA
jgi:hypothetical protein